MTESAPQGFEFVGRELNVALGEARTALEAYVEQPGNVSLLERCGGELHQVQGVLRVLEIYGAALLAEEMEQVATYLAANDGEYKNQAESLDALMRAMVQLPGYLERVLAGGRDLALVLLPLLNDLRSVRGSALLSEGTLLLLNLKSDRQAQPQPVAPGGEALSVEQWGRRLRPRFQLGLVGWIRGDRPEQNLAALAEVAQKLEQVAARQPVFQLWWVVGAVVEALQEHGLAGGVSIKRLLGLADREIKRLYELGEARYAQAPAVDLLNNLLYYVGRAESKGPRVTAVRASFRLNELLPMDDVIDQERENLSAPSVKLMQTVAAAIREDLDKVKDVLDIFMRRGSDQPQSLTPQVEMLRKIGDTLGVLGLGELRAAVQAQTERLGQIVAGTLHPDGNVLVDIAAALIGVEDRLDDRLVGMILPRAAGASGAEDGVDIDFQQVQAAVLRECILNLVRLKESVAQSVGGTLDTAGLDSWPDLMRGLKAGLLMLGKGRAVELVEAIRERLVPVMQPGGALSLRGNSIDRLADAIVSLEYYMETLQAGRSDPWYMLDNAQASLAAMDAAPAAAVPTVTSPAGGGYEPTLLIDSPAGAGSQTATLVAQTEVIPPLLQAGSPAPARAAEAGDPELVMLFVEEAREELARISRHFPLWERNPLEIGALQTVRRSFHTLKGSGRMVGARDLAEFAWAVENLLNRLLDNTLSRTPAISATLHDAVTALPELVAQLEDGTAPVANVAGIIARSHQLAANREGAFDATLTSVAQSPVQPAPAASAEAAESPPGVESLPSSLEADDPLAPAFVTTLPDVAPGIDVAPGTDEPLTALERSLAPGPETDDAALDVAASHEAAQAMPAPAQAQEDTSSDDVLRDIYMRETQAHIAAVRAFLQQERQQPSPHVITEPVYRACHTLSGSSKMAEARHGIRLAEPLDHWLRKAFDSGLGLESQDLALLSDCMAAMETVAAHLDETTGYFMRHDGLVERIEAAEKELDRRIAESLEQQRSAEPPGPVSQDGFTAQADAQPTPEAPVPAEPAEPAVATAAVSGSRPQAEPRPDYDHEVASIFTEEATELLEVCDNQLAAWRAAPADATLLAALKRPLHTLKGGARMAQITAMGDLSHELESLVNHIDGGMLPPSDGAFDVLQAGLDDLARMRDGVVEGRGIAPARDTLARIAALLRGEASPEAATPMVAEQQAQPPEQPPAQTEAAAEPAAWTAEESAATVAGLDGSWAQDIAEAAAAKLAAHGEIPLEAPVVPQWDYAAAGSPPAESPVAQAAVPDPLPPPQAVPPGREPGAEAARPEMARVDAELLDQLLNVSGEVSISRARLEQQVSNIDFNLAELSRTVTRLKEQQRKLEIETEKQILHRHQAEDDHRAEFDPLELDRYSAIQQFSRSLAETASDVASIQQLLETLVQETQNQLQQQARTVTELQNGLMRTRMVPFQRHVQRLGRIVRQAATDTGKRAELHVTGASGELDRQVLERMLPPFEHMLRNAVVHGIEAPAEREAAGKSATGRITLSLQREGAEVIVVITDDGAGMKLHAIRDKGQALGLIQPGQQLSDEEAMQLVLEPGFSTATSITQQAGRGVGMDVVATEIKRLGGALHMETHAGEGTKFTIRLPFTLAISHALVVRTGDEYYALPLTAVEGVLRLSKDEVAGHLGRETATFDHGGQKYRFQALAAFVGLEPSPLPEGDVTVPVVLVRAGEHSTGLVADELIGSREIVVKSVGPQVSCIRGISGATILGDGRIVIILDIGALVRSEWRSRQAPVARDKGDRRILAMVVDDSITVRRVTQRLLERNGMRVVTARDGMDAVTQLQEHEPDIILLDIEMPRMDGYEVASHVRNDPRLRDVPIIMITSRVGEKHRARAIELGVDDYLGKPYQETQLLDAIAPLVEKHRENQRGRRVNADG